MAAKRRRIRKKENEGWSQKVEVIPTLRPMNSAAKRLAVQGSVLFCVSCAFSRLNPALPVSEPGRSFYRGSQGGRGGERRDVPRTYCCRVIAAAEVGGSRDAATHSGLRQGSRSHLLLISPGGGGGCFAINLPIVQKAGSGPVHHRNPEPAVNHSIAWFAMKNYAAISCADGRTDELSLR